MRAYVRLELAYPAYLRERARERRVTRKLDLDEIAERLALPETTVYDRIIGLPLAPRAARGTGRATRVPGGHA
jgi:hypothetical protein